MIRYTSEAQTAIVRALVAGGSEGVLLPKLCKLEPKRQLPRGASVERRFFYNICWGFAECWYWRGTIDADGYGQVKNRSRYLGELLAHRVAWRLFNGFIPEGLSVLHRCDVRNCVNPEHLFLGTQTDNMADMVAKGRYVHGRKYCGSSHKNALLTEDQVREIRTLRAAGNITYSELSARFGVSPGYLCSIVHRKRWRHIED